MGVKILKSKKKYIVFGNGLNSFKQPKGKMLNFGNAGTLARLMSGLLATNPDLKVKLTGDKSLNKRDMKRIIEPLSKIGCLFYPKNASFAECNFQICWIYLEIKKKMGCFFKIEFCFFL